ALRAGVERDVIGSVLEALTVDEALRIFREAGVLEAVMNEMMKKIKQYLQHRAGNMEVGVLTFSNVYGICGRFSV
ncbi:MAG: cobalt-precorrin-6A synthase, partial [Lachnospiraceae bacterium]|nr:cobalt-precorrin-6A synthase [Lachnospiraceae bacterium]